MATATATRAVKQPEPLPAANSDFYEVYETLSAEELATVKRVRAFMEFKVAPVITKYWVDDAIPPLWRLTASRWSPSSPAKLCRIRIRLPTCAPKRKKWGAR
jgi:hypothetical protein